MDMTTRFQRQLDLANPAQLKVPITILGAGAVGSFTTLTLAKLGCSSLTVYDPDTVEVHNLPNQYFSVPSASLRDVNSEIRYRQP